MGAMRTLTVGERILVHLLQFGRFYDAYVCPQEVAQAGIAECLGISRAHAAIELRRQMDAGRVEVRTAHVQGLPTRRKVYRLTPRGRGRAQSLRAQALQRTVELVHPDGSVELAPGARALEGLRRHGVSEARGVFLLLTRRRIDLRDPRLRWRPSPPPRVRVRSAEARAREQFARTFQRPVAWQFEVILGPPHVPPFPAAA